MEGRGFQFTPYGLTQLGDASGATALPEGQEFSPGVVVAAVPVDSSMAPQAMLKVVKPGPGLGEAMAQVVKVASLTGPREVVKAAKARAKAIRAELRRMKALEKELAELDRLIAAAAKPVAAVRPIESARHAR